MPMYDFKCSCGKAFTDFKKIEERDSPTFCKCGEQAVRSQVYLAGVVTDIQPYISPVSGRVISSKADEREECIRHGKIIDEPGLREDIKRWGEETREKDLQWVDNSVATALTDMSVQGKV